MIEICNLRNCKMEYVYDVRIGGRSILGNPFYTKDESKRVETCDKYEEYFNKSIVINDDFRKEINRLIEIYVRNGKLRLFCQCYPKRCHCKIIKDFIINFVDNMSEDLRKEILCA